MVGMRRVLTYAICLVLLMTFAAPAFAQRREREVTARDLEGVRRNRYREFHAGRRALGG